jgi:hypothetical protein
MIPSLLETLITIYTPNLNLNGLFYILYFSTLNHLPVLKGKNEKAIISLRPWRLERSPVERDASSGGWEKRLNREGARLH